MVSNFMMSIQVYASCVSVDEPNDYQEALHKNHFWSNHVKNEERHYIGSKKKGTSYLQQKRKEKKKKRLTGLVTFLSRTVCLKGVIAENI